MPEQLPDVRFLTVAEVAAIMRVSKMTVYRLVHAGELPAIRFGRSYRVPGVGCHRRAAQARLRRRAEPRSTRPVAARGRLGVGGPARCARLL